MIKGLHACLCQIKALENVPRFHMIFPVYSVSLSGITDNIQNEYRVLLLLLKLCVILFCGAFALSSSRLHYFICNI
jgi:hypothetical protein